MQPAAAVGTSRLVIVAAFVLAALGALLYGRRLTALLKGRKSVLDTRAAASVKGLQVSISASKPCTLSQRFVPMFLFS